MSTSSADYMVPIVVFCVSLCTVCVLGYKDVLGLIWEGSQLFIALNQWELII